MICVTRRSRSPAPECADGTLTGRDVRNGSLTGRDVRDGTGRNLGNFPQAFTHLALINAVMHVIRAEAELTGASSGARVGGLSLEAKAHWTAQS